MKYIIKSLEARNQKKPYYRDSNKWRVGAFSEDIFFVSEPNKATRFDSESEAQRWAREVLFLVRFETISQASESNSATDLHRASPRLSDPSASYSKSELSAPSVEPPPTQSAQHCLTEAPQEQKPS